jgi:hypothetical protein
MSDFKAECLPLLIGSLPLADHQAAVDLILATTPGIPGWAQLPVFQEEGMVPQFMPGMPGLCQEADRVFVDLNSGDFEAALTAFYEEYLEAAAAAQALEASRFALSPGTARGFFDLQARLERLDPPPVALKGQVTGPLTFGLGLKDRHGRAVFYDLQARDAAVKLLALKAAWQVEKMKALGVPVIIFVDEPALAGYGSSELISISDQEIATCLTEVFEAIHQAGGLAGIHVCANTDWGLILGTGLDVVNFDAYGYAERFLLYAGPLRAFFKRGGIVAWGLVPTGPAEAVEGETVDSLAARWDGLREAVAGLGIAADTLHRQSLITPSCGLGSRSLAHTERVLALTRGLSDRLRRI